MRAVYGVNTNGVGSALVVRSIVSALEPCSIIVSNCSRLHSLLGDLPASASSNLLVLPAFFRNLFISSLIKLSPFSWFLFKRFSTVLVCDDIPFLFVSNQILFLQQISLFKEHSLKWRILRLYFLLTLPKCRSIIVQSAQMASYLRLFCPYIAPRVIVFSHVLPS
jgi:hypothetical protein